MFEKYPSRFVPALFFTTALAFQPFAGTYAQGSVGLPGGFNALLGTPQKADAKSETPVAKPEEDHHEVLRKDAIHNPVLWTKPDNIAGLDMYNGIGGVKHMPKAPFTFEAEDMNGTNPKFDVRDQDGTKWRVKLGEEPRPEVVASRFLWAMGYFVNEDYVLPTADIQNLQIKRGANLAPNGHITDARFARKPGGEKKIGIWEWKNNPFTGTREFNGLRVMMAVLNSWDLKDVNNAVYSDAKTGQQLFLVSDIGATFASNQISTRAKDKGNVESYKKSKFITKVDGKSVSFGTPKPPAGLFPVIADISTGDYERRLGFGWIGRNIPVADARWVGSMLAQLTHQQIVDAFRAGHFPPEVAAEYVGIVESRIAELKDLQPRK